MCEFTLFIARHYSHSYSRNLSPKTSCATSSLDWMRRLKPYAQLLHVLKCSSAIRQWMTFPCTQVDRKALPTLRMNHYTSLQSQAPSIMSQQCRHSQVSIVWGRTQWYNPAMWLPPPLVEMDADLIMQWWLLLSICSVAYISMDLSPRPKPFS